MGCRLFLPRDALLDQALIGSASRDEAKRLAGWLSRSYVRIALPDELVKLMKRGLLESVEEVVTSEHHEHPLHEGIIDGYLCYEERPLGGSPRFVVRIMYICISQQVADELGAALFAKLNPFLEFPGYEEIFIDSLACQQKSDTMLSDLDGYDRWSEWDSLSDLATVGRQCTLVG